MAVEIEMDRFVGRQEVVADQLVNPPRTLADLKFENFGKYKLNDPSTENAKLKCPRVPKSLLSDARGFEPSDGHCNEPKIMSLGPYHYGNPKLKRGEGIKCKLAFYLFESAGLIGKLDGLYDKISGKVQMLRSCYDWKSTENYSDEEFLVRMMMDGCALLCYIDNFNAWNGDKDNQEKFGIRYHDLSHLQRDVLLLENQLPYELLLELVKNVPGYDTSRWMALYLKFVGVIEEEEEEAYSFPQKMRKFCSGPFPAIGQIIGWQRRPNPDEESVINPNEEWVKNPNKESEPRHLLDLYLKHWLGAKRSEKKIDGRGQEKVIGNVKELMAAGIRIKPSPTRYLKDISFTSNVITGCLRIPFITINNSTKDLFFNLIAWERCSGRCPYFISYLCFLDSLIDHAEDVRELQSAKVLQNNLGTHEEVAQFFNTLSATFESNFNAYGDVRGKIRKHLKDHYNNKLKRWMTQCLDTYFDSPWTIIAWVGAILVLILTAVQTYFSAFSH